LAGTTVFHSIPSQRPPFGQCHNLTKQAKAAIVHLQKSGFQTAECGTYHLLLRDLVVIQGDSPAYDKNGEPREEVRKKSEAAMEMYDKVIDEFKRLFPIQFIK